MPDSGSTPTKSRSTDAADHAAPGTADRRPLLREVATLAVAFVTGTAIAALLGAQDLGTALTFGQIAFAGTLTWILLRH